MSTSTVTEHVEKLKTLLGNENAAKVISHVDDKVRAFREKQKEQYESLIKENAAAQALPDVQLPEEAEGHARSVLLSLMQCDLASILCTLAIAGNEDLAEFASHMIRHYQQAEQREQLSRLASLIAGGAVVAMSSEEPASERTAPPS